MVTIYKECNNKLTIVFTGGVDYIFSYESLIGIGYKNTFILDSYYKNYSVTTNKHISAAKDLYSYFILVNSGSFTAIKNSNFSKDLLESILKEYKDGLKVKAILESKKDSLINDKDYLQLIKILGQYSAVNPVNLQFKELNTVNKTLLSFKAGAVTFNILKTFTKGGQLKKIKINRILLNPI